MEERSNRGRVCREGEFQKVGMDYFKLIQSFEFLSEEFGICWISKANASFNHLNTDCFSTEGRYDLAYSILRSEVGRLFS